MARLSAPSRRDAPGPAEPPAPVKASPDILLYALALMIWTSIWRIQDLVPALGALKLHLLATALAFGLFVIDRDPARRTALLQPAMLVCAAGLVCVAILGIPMSLWPRNSLTALARELIPNLLLMVMLAASIRGLRDLEWIAMATILGACVYAVFAMLMFGIDASGRLGDLAYYDGNDLALVLLCTMPLALYFLVRGGWGRRILAAASLTMIGAAFVSSGSRGGFLGLVAVLAFVLVAYRTIPLRIRLVAVVGGFGLFALLAGEAYWTKMRTLSEIQQDYNWSGRAPEGRMEVWRRGLGYMGDHPILGVGLRNFQLAEGMLSEEARARAERGRGFKWSAAHNSFLEVGVEMGIPGLVFFLGMFVVAFRLLGRIRRGPELPESPTLGAAAFASTLTASFIGFCVAGMFVSADQFTLLYLLIGMTLALAKLEDVERYRALGWLDLPDGLPPEPRVRLVARERALARPVPSQHDRQGPNGARPEWGRRGRRVAAEARDR